MVSRRFLMLKEFETAKVKIAISSVALGPMIEAPMTFPDFFSEITFINPSDSSSMRAIPEPKKSNLLWWGVAAAGGLLLILAIVKHKENP